MDGNSGTPVSPGLPGHLIRRLHQFSTHVFSQRVQEAGFDLTPVQFAALDALRHSPGVDQAGLAEMIAKDRATTGAVVDRLRKKGLISRVVSDRDRRGRELRLTEEGEATIAAMLPIVTRLQRETLPGLDDAEYRQFVDLAAKAVRSARAASDD